MSNHPLLPTAGQRVLRAASCTQQQRPRAVKPKRKRGPPPARPPHHAAWPDDDHDSRIVLIVRDIARADVEASVRAFDRLAKPAG